MGVNHALLNSWLNAELQNQIIGLSKKKMAMTRFNVIRWNRYTCSNTCVPLHSSTDLRFKGSTLGWTLKMFPNIQDMWVCLWKIETDQTGLENDQTGLSFNLLSVLIMAHHLTYLIVYIKRVEGRGVLL